MRIGIDAGGTFTDAVLFHPERGVVASAKAPTADDLSLGIAGVIDAVIDGHDPAGISLVSLSTTLATNALVEGIVRPVGLVFVGFGSAELDRGGLRQALAGGPVMEVAGGHDANGNERFPLELEAITEWASAVDEHIEAFAVTSQFSVRNPAHEIAIRQALAPLGRPVTCSHELAAELDGPRRALTCVLNAGLTGLIADLCRAARMMLDEREISAPLMIVRSDGSLMDAAVAAERPIETILSGPAASLIGASYLVATGQPAEAEHPAPSSLVVTDIGGTTTDVGFVRNGLPVVASSGATVGGHRTLVEAVQVTTTGLGGDSEITFDHQSSPTGLTIGPRRVVPLSVLAADEPELVTDTLARREHYRPEYVSFVRLRGTEAATNSTERQVIERLGDAWLPVDVAAPTSRDTLALRSLASRGLVQLAGFTPTDAITALELLPATDQARAVASAGAALLARADGGGHPVCVDGDALARWVLDSVCRRSAEAILEATLTHDGFPPGTAATAAVQRAIDEEADRGIDGKVDRETEPEPVDQALAGSPPDRRATSIRIGPNWPVVGLGAGSAIYHPPATRLLDAVCVIPEHAGVANAVGAAVGLVRVTGRTTVSQPSRGRYRIHLRDAGSDLGDVEPAIDRAVALLSEQVIERAEQAGASTVELTVDVERRTAEVGGRPYLVEARVTVVGIGPPRELAATIG